MQARKERGAPGERPFAHVAVRRNAARVEGNLRRRRQLGRFGDADLPAGINREQMRRVAVMVVGGVEFRIFRVVQFGHPFEQLAPAADARRDQLVPQRGDFIPKLLVHAEHVRRGHRVVEQVPDNFLVVTHAVLDRAVFGRPAVGHDQPPIGQRLQMVHPEFAGFLHHRPGRLLQILFVAGEGVMFPETMAIPGVGGLVPFPAHAAIYIVRGADGPAAAWSSRRRAF